MGVVFALFLAAMQPPSEPVSAPVTNVTVFSDRAKVTRQVQLPLSKGTHRLTFGTLPPGAEAQSITLDADGATVTRVEVHRGNLGELATSQVDQALKELDDARAAVRALAEQRINREEARRVPLFRKTFAAVPELTLVPGLSSSAFLMAKVVNESDKPLLRGAANLYVGADLVGQAMVDPTSVGEKTRLPLGVDDAVKVERKVELVTATRGLISKDDVSTYQVQIDILSARPQQVAARVLDQIPLSGADKVEVKLISSEPAASLDKDLGLLEWNTTLSPNQKRTLTFSYSVTRPKGERLQQWSP